MSALGNILPLPILVTEQSEVQRTKDILKRDTQWISSEVINGQENVTADWKRQGLIFSVDDGERELFPAYQFDAAWQPIPVIKDILANLHNMTDGWKIAAWFHFPSSWLSYRKSDGTVAPVAPKDALDRGADVIAAARKISASYVA